jgi:hypothetical protein
MSAIEPTPSVNWSKQIVKYSQSLVGDLYFWSPVVDTMSVESNRDKNVEAIFRKLAERWQKETINFSLAYQKTGHEAYKKIVALGWPVVPIILGDLRQKPDLWFDALATITGEDPIIDHPEIYGDVKAMAQRWIDWGKQKRL